MPSAINRAFLQIVRRAETSTPENLVQTFVDDGVLFTQLSSRDHQVLFGRRGTGKTHVLYYLRETAREAKDLAVYVDIRSVGSTGGLYDDQSLPLAGRGTTLLVDVLTAIHDQLMTHVLEVPFDSDGDFNRACDAADAFAVEATRVRVAGEEEQEVKLARTATEGNKTAFAGEIGPQPRLKGELASEESRSEASETRIARKGVVEHHIVFGGVADALRRLARLLPGNRIWILLDEWSVIPVELQPLLADMLKRCLFPVEALSVKIAAIKERSVFQTPLARGGYLGIELGADAFADVDLDDFMVFGNNAERAKGFFAELLFKHVLALLTEHGQGEDAPSDAEALVRHGFTQVTAFEELVRAAEGVPRDAINIAAVAARQAGNEFVSVPHVRSSARTWYLRDKEPTVDPYPEARSLLDWIVDRVIGERRARAFLLRQGAHSKGALIDQLYDARVLHLVKRGISGRDQPGVRYNVYSIDYGCYVELINTAKAPRGLFEVNHGEIEGGEFVEVPQDDYRAIRRAILDLEEFERRGLPGPAG